MIDAKRLANQCARRHGFAKATQIVYDARRRYGAKFVKGVRGYRSKGVYRQAACIIALPAHWLGQPTAVAFPSPDIEIERTKTTKSQWRQFTKFRRLARFNSFEYAFEKAYHRKPSEDVGKLIAELTEKGLMILDLSKAKPTRHKYAKPRGLFPKEDDSN